MAPPASRVALAEMAPGRRAVLARLKSRGEATADSLAADLGLTVGAVRQQLGPLGEAGLVAHRDERQGRAAPALVLPHAGGRGAVPQALWATHQPAARLHRRV